MFKLQKHRVHVGFQSRVILDHFGELLDVPNFCGAREKFDDEHFSSIDELCEGCGQWGHLVGIVGHPCGDAEFVGKSINHCCVLVGVVVRERAPGDACVCRNGFRSEGFEALGAR